MIGGAMVAPPGSVVLVTGGLLMNAPMSSVVESVLFAALASIAAKRVDRDVIADGSSHDVAVNLMATVDGWSVACDLSAGVKVGHGGSRVSSAAVAPAAVLGHVCELLALAFGDDEVLAVLSAIERKHAGTGAVDCSKSWQERAEAFAKSLRANVEQSFAGSVRVDLASCEVLAGAPSLEAVAGRE